MNLSEQLFKENHKRSKASRKQVQENAVSNKISEVLDSFLQDVAQMTGAISYADIMDHDYTTEDIKQLKSLRKRWKEEAQYDDADLDSIAEEVANIVANNPIEELFNPELNLEIGDVASGIDANVDASDSSFGFLGGKSGDVKKEFIDPEEIELNKKDPFACYATEGKKRRRTEALSLTSLERLPREELIQMTRDYIDNHSAFYEDYEDFFNHHFGERFGYESLDDLVDQDIAWYYYNIVKHTEKEYPNYYKTTGEPRLTELFDPKLNLKVGDVASNIGANVNAKGASFGFLGGTAGDTDGSDSEVDEELLNEEGRSGRFTRPAVPNDVKTYLSAISKLAKKLFSTYGRDRISDDQLAIYELEDAINGDDQLLKLYRELKKVPGVQFEDYGGFVGFGREENAIVWLAWDEEPSVVLCYNDGHYLEVSSDGKIHWQDDGTEPSSGPVIYTGESMTLEPEEYDDEVLEEISAKANEGYLYLRDLYKKLPGILDKVESILDSFEGYEDIFDVLGESKKRVKESADLDCCAICYGKIDYDDPDSYTYPESGPYEGELVHTRCLKKARRPW